MMQQSPVISEAEAIDRILRNTSEKRDKSQPHFSVYMGAGVSLEAGVPAASQICNSIVQDYMNESSETEAAVKARLRWDNSSERYSVCLGTRYSTQADRVDFFRSILKGKRPSFAHHALALLATERFITSTTITSNFDKLLESAFIAQGVTECQPIRTETELKYWSHTNDIHFLLKVHGDYDTHNLMNTIDEVISVPEKFREKIADLMYRSGLVVLGVAGNEKAVIKLFEELEKQATSDSAHPILNYGLLWGVFVGDIKPAGITDQEAANLVQAQLAKGVVNPDIVRIIERMNHLEGRSSFFPLWGAGNFLFELVKKTRDKALLGKAHLYLDQDVRLRTRFAETGYPETVIKSHFAKLQRERQRLEKRRREGAVPQDLPSLELKARHVTAPAEIRIYYGDITRRAHMTLKEFEKGRRAIISSDDTFISAGGGVAAQILHKAGQGYLLNELSKFSQLKQGTVLVTSGGDLPLHYIFHAAAIEINKNPAMDLEQEPNDLYLASIQSVQDAMTDAIQKASELGIRWLWVSLMASGTGGLTAQNSLEGILQAIVSNLAAFTQEITFLIFVYSYRDLERHTIRTILETKLGSDFVIENT